ncbi:MAG: hypothetical protein K2L27_06180 [Muribaculaceae bacterium]|nr:hypothetical protein [Muribaculaceae bacterium]
MQQETLAAARDAWLAAARRRTDRRRCKRYTYGDQWADAAASDASITEAELATRAGRRPLTNNLIRQLVKTVVGRYRSIADDKGTYAAEPGSAAHLNQLAELDSRMLEEFLISGMAIQRIVAERRMQGTGVWVDNVSPDRFFVNDFRDPRGFDIELAGMLHDMNPAELIARFAGADRDRAERIRRIYTDTTPAAIPGRLDAVDFFTPAPGKWRAIEVWTLDAVAPTQRQHTRTTRRTARTHTDTARVGFAWQCRWLAPDGTLLASYPSPFAHRQHPFAVKFYPLTDGEVHSFVDDLLDQQRCINRLITMIDHIMSCSAKGVLLFPVEQLPDNMTWNDVTEAWAAADGVIPVTGTGDLPRQVVTNGGAAGAYQLLELQMKLFEDISGVGDTLLGRNDRAATGAGLYEAQLRNATIALYDLLLTFESFTKIRDDKMKNC